MKLGYLCVAGSLGWGYWDKDSSDIDLRGVYYRSQKETILHTAKEQIEIHPENLEPLETVFWSFDKFFHHLENSNPTAIEWLLSPSLFSDEVFVKFRVLAKSGEFNRYKLAMHYISMAKYNYYKYIDNLIPKRQQYVERGLRSALSVADGNLPIMYMKNFSIRKEEEIEITIKTIEDYIRETNLPKHDKFFQKYRDVVEELL